jgi:hypothetical protein
LQLVRLEKELHIFVEPAWQAAFLKHPTLMHITAFIYSYIHIPGTILYLIVLYYFCVTRTIRRLDGSGDSKLGVHVQAYGPGLYQARRRTMALCNLLAFIVFTFWPCMPPRMLPEVLATDNDPGYHFLDPTHGESELKSVWTSNRFCNLYGKFTHLYLSKFNI